MVALCAARDIALVGDEVFADYELEPGARAAAGPVAGRGEALTFSLGGLSKSIGLPQVKLAWIGVSGPERLVSRALERLELICDTYLSVSTPVQVAASDLLERGAAIRTQIGRRVSSNYQHLRARVREASGCRALPSEGGWYAVLQVPSLEPEEALVLDLVRTAGVLVHPGYFFDFPRESYLILSLLPREACFVEGLERVLDRFEVRCA
jgi:alanine-synthesizing transaminase